MCLLAVVVTGQNISKIQSQLLIYMYWQAKNVWGFDFSVFLIHFDVLILITGIFILTSSFLNQFLIENVLSE